MTFLRLNGYEIPVEVGSSDRATKRYGEGEASYLGRPRRNRRGTPSLFDNSTPLCFTQGQADSLEGLVEGRGHHFPFDEHSASDDGLTIEAPSVGNFTIDTTPRASRFGFGFLVVDPASTVTWNPELRDKWTVLYWAITAGLWRRIVVRSDGAKWQNENRLDALVTTELVVSAGTVTLDDRYDGYDDLVILPYEADEDFVTGSYRWTTAHETRAAWPFDHNARDATRDGDVTAPHDGTAAGSVTFVRGDGPVFGYADFTGAGADLITVPDEAELNPTETDAFSVEMWFRLDSSPQLSRHLVTKATPAALFATPGWQLNLGPGGSDAGKIQWIVISSGVEINLISGPVPAADTWTHVVATWGGSTDTARLYVNAVLEGTSAVSTTSSIATANPVLFGGAPITGFTSIDGGIADVRFHRDELDAAEVAERFRIGSAGRRVPLPRPWSRLPRLDMHGSIQGFRQPIEVVGEVQDQPHEQGTIAGVRESDLRRVPFALDESKAEQRDLGPTPYAQWILDSRYLVPDPQGSELRAAYGPWSATDTGMTKGRPGLFDRGESWGAGSFEVELPDAVSAGLAGASQATMLAWVNRSALGSTDTVAILGSATTGTKLGLSVTSGNQLRIRARSEAAEALETFADAAAIVPVGWSLVAGTVDLPTDTMRLFINGELLATSGVLTFTRATFNGDASTLNRIGRNLSGGEIWAGDIATVSVFRRALGAKEQRRIYELGRRGVLR